MSAEIVPFALHHIDDLYRIEKACFSMPWTRESLVSEFVNSYARYFVLVDEGVAAGYCGAHFIFDEGHITNIAVLPEYRRRGYGKSLVKYLINRAEKEGVKFLTLEVRVSNGAAQGLYRGFGFQAAGIRRGYYRRPDEDAMLMRLDMPGEG